MKQYAPEDLLLFLRKTDELLGREFEMLIIGGAAASLAYGATKTTTDIDLAHQPPDELQTALERAGRETGIRIPVQFVGIFEPPYCYEERLRPLPEPRLARLLVYFPEQHDLALMKMVRGYENDLQAVEEMHRETPFDLNILLERFLGEMTQVNGDPRVIRINFLLLVERLFGSQSMSRIEETVQQWPPLAPFSG